MSSACSEQPADTSSLYSEALSEISEQSIAEEYDPVIAEIAAAYQSNALRVIWDMKLWDGCLYVGAGDYDKNASPGVAKRYNLSEQKWEVCGKIPDEQIGRFTVLDGTLMIPGIDPTEDWSLGNYYVLKNGEFEMERVLPGGIHNFDLALYDGTLFAALGVSSGSFPVVARKAGDEEFTFVEFVDKNGDVLSTAGFREVRVYDFFQTDGGLYALLQLDGNRYIYRYDGNRFVYHTSWNNKIVVKGYAYVPVLEKLTVGKTVYFATGLLFETTDMKNYRDITPKGVDWVADIHYDGENIYLLTNSMIDGGYMIDVMIMNGDSFETVTSIERTVPSQSFEYDGDVFYIGLGDKSNVSAEKGKIICVKPQWRSGIEE